jgi:hypothetical protein
MHEYTDFTLLLSYVMALPINPTHLLTQFPTSRLSFYYQVIRIGRNLNLRSSSSPSLSPLIVPFTSPSITFKIGPGWSSKPPWHLPPACPYQNEIKNNNKKQNSTQGLLKPLCLNIHPSAAAKQHPTLLFLLASRLFFILVILPGILGLTHLHAHLHIGS